MNRLRWACGTLVLFFLVGRAATAAPCLPGSLQDYINLGSAGCSVGTVSVTDFAIAPGQSFATPIAPQTILVTPGGTVDAPTLDLTFNVNAAAGELLESFLHFFASAPTLFGAGIALGSASASGDGVVTAIQDLCPDGAFFSNVPLGCPTSAEALIVFQSESDSLLAAEAFLAAAGFVDVFADVAVDGGLAGSASLASVRLSFETVPEPSTALLAGLGLALLARWRPRRES